MRRGLALVAAVAALAATAPAALAAAPGALPPVGARGPLVTGRLSDDRTITRWAHPLERAKIRVAPTRMGWTLARLHPSTEDGFPEVYVARRAKGDRDGITWIEVDVPMRPNGQRGWVERSALGSFHVVRTRLVVDRRS